MSGFCYPTLTFIWPDIGNTSNMLLMYALGCWLLLLCVRHLHLSLTSRLQHKLNPPQPNPNSSLSHAVFTVIHPRAVPAPESLRPKDCIACADLLRVKFASLWLILTNFAFRHFLLDFSFIFVNLCISQCKSVCLHINWWRDASEITSWADNQTSMTFAATIWKSNRTKNSYNMPNLILSQRTRISLK